MNLSPVIFDESRAGLVVCRGLAAAYALALQVLLASTMAAGMAMAPADAAVLCYGSGDTNGGQQPSHSPAGSADCILSCAQGLSAAAILPSDISSAPVSPLGRQLEPGVQRPLSSFRRARLRNSPKVLRRTRDRTRLRRIVTRHLQGDRYVILYAHAVCAVRHRNRDAALAPMSHSKPAKPKRAAPTKPC